MRILFQQTLLLHILVMINFLHPSVSLYTLTNHSSQYDLLENDFSIIREAEKFKEDIQIKISNVYLFLDNRTE